jgi:hypothetical protein
MMSISLRSHFQVPRYQHVVSKLSKSYFTTWRPTHVHLEVGVSSFRFEGRFTPYRMCLPPTFAPEINVNIYHSDAFIHHASLPILGDLSNSSFSNIITWPFTHLTDASPRGFSIYVLHRLPFIRGGVTPYATRFMCPGQHASSVK